VTTLEIIVIAVVVVFGLLALGGGSVLRRRREAGSSEFAAEIDRANRDLAAAHAADNGWEPARVGEAARNAFTAEQPNATIDHLELIQVIDPPGTDDDKAVFRVVAADRDYLLTLGRAGENWFLETLD
jgi:hypothetical protein